MSNDEGDLWKVRGDRIEVLGLKTDLYFFSSSS
jgi:hypothetical protein